MKEFQTFAEEIAKQAGNIMREHFSLRMKKELKQDASPVTVADTTINALLIEAVKKHFPTHSVLGEEESYENTASDYVWVCDPIDGTIPFSHGVRLSTFSLALVRDGVSILGVVYEPFSDRLFMARKNNGAFLNGERIFVSKINSIRGSVGNFEMFFTAKYDVYPLVSYLNKNAMGSITKFCSFVLPSVLVAAGEFAYTIFPHSSTHDVAAVKIIVEEAGGKVTDLFGNEQRYDQPINGAIVSNRALHEQLVDLAKKYVVENV